jgi:hypothetical protein
MTLNDDIQFVGKLIDQYAARAPQKHVAAEDPEDDGAPPDMQAGPVDEEGWVEWKPIPSTLRESDVAEVEEEFGVEFPPLFRAYLLARFQLFDQLQSVRHGQGLLMTAVPSGQRLDPIRESLEVWQSSPLIPAGFIPFAEWGDGFGPVAFDTSKRASDGDCPVVWMDHELLIELDDDGSSGNSDAVRALAQPLYGSFREFLADVFAGE